MLKMLNVFKISLLQKIVLATINSVGEHLCNFEQTDEKPILRYPRKKAHRSVGHIFWEVKTLNLFKLVFSTILFEQTSKTIAEQMHLHWD